MTVKTLASHLHQLVNPNGILDEVLRLQSYYSTVSHSDIVYRALRHFIAVPSDIPNYPLLVVDEYQDFNRLETEFISALGQKIPLLIAGDDDQALYGFKDAKPLFIRELHADKNFAKFELPYCSRCPEVIVNAYNEVVRVASSIGLLQGRVEKKYYCHVDSKKEDNKNHPHIEHVHCTVQRKSSPYMAKYIIQKITEIPAAEIIEANEKGFPAVLVIGPSQFVKQVFSEIKKVRPHAIFKKSESAEMNIFHGYRFISTDSESNLGWRLLLEFEPVPKAKEVIKKALEENISLKGLIPADYLQQHLKIAHLIGELIANGELPADKEFWLEAQVKMDVQRILKSLEIDSDQDEEPAEKNPEIPYILCTSLSGSKGLSAQYVFIVGMNNGHFPQDERNITDNEICSFLVGISRTRKKCYLMSCGRFGADSLQPSIFLKWTAPFLREQRVDSKYFQAFAN